MNEASSTPDTCTTSNYEQKAAIDSLKPTDTEAPDAKGLADHSSVVEGSTQRLLPDNLAKYRSRLGSNEHVLLDMSRCSIKIPSLSTLADYLALLNIPLVSLTLSRNNMGAKGAALLGKALVTNNTLQFLELEQCELIGSAYRPDYDGVKALAKGFESVRSTLRFVSLADNILQPEGCRIVLGALSFHPSLTALDISRNALSVLGDKQGFLALSYVIRYAPLLCWLAIDDNPLPPSSWPVLRASLAQNASLTFVSALQCDVTLDQLHDATASATHASVLTDLQC